MEATLFEKYKIPYKTRETERGNLMKELMETLNVTRKGNFKPLTMPRMGVILEKIPTDALYVLISKCKNAGEQAKKRREFAKEEDKKNMDTYWSAYSKVFWWELKVKK